MENYLYEAGENDGYFIKVDSETFKDSFPAPYEQIANYDGKCAQNPNTDDAEGEIDTGYDSYDEGSGSDTGSDNGSDSGSDNGSDSGSDNGSDSGSDTGSNDECHKQCDDNDENSDDNDGNSDDNDGNSGNE